MTGLRNTGNILPNPDAIQEFKVQTNSYNAEYGRFSSGIINVITKAGTNAYKGSAFEYFRDGQHEREGVGLACWRRRRSSATSSAARSAARSRANKTFFFGTYSGLRQTTQHVPEHGHRADRAGADRRLQRRRGPCPNDPGDRPDVRLQRRRRRDLPEPARSGRDEDHQQLHPAGQRPRRHLAGLRAEPLRHRRDPDQARSPAQRRPPPVAAATS